MFNSIAKNAETSVNSMMNTTTRAINSGLNSISDAADSTLTSIYNAAKNTPVINSLLPLNNSNSSNSTTTLSDMFVDAANAVVNGTNSATNAVVNGANSAANSVLNSANTAANNAANVFTNVNNANVVANSAKSGIFSPFIIFGILIGIFGVLIYFFKNQIKDACDSLMNSFGAKKDEPVPVPVPAPEPPMKDSPAPVTSGPDTSGLLGKFMQTNGTKEVFNVSKNDFTYNDSEPMCRALGAELATYDQVMAAWKKGADWCNYGWAKGQVAIYPTQQTTFDRLQSGPEEDQNACGKPGVNGGYFDNPDLRFGVNCYGVKPSQNANDERILMEKGVIPRTPATIKMDQQAQEFKEQLGTVGVLPFNENKWDE